MIIIGDAKTELKKLGTRSVNCCVTSPPYFGLRDYGVDGQLGLEKTPDEYVKNLVDVFQEVKRVLKDDGTLWLNLGDSYCGYKGAHYGDTKGNLQARTPDSEGKRIDVGTPQTSGLKNKDLIGIPWRVAFALQADGWYLRQDIIWAKPNPMPESVKDRCTKAHEYIFLFSKSPRYYFDHEAIMEPAVRAGCIPSGGKGYIQHSAGGHNKDGLSDNAKKPVKDTKNKRSVWTVSTKPYKGAHFATFPPDLIEPCILAGCPHGGIVLDPFGGSGTTGKVAKKNERNFIIIELNQDYEPLISERIGIAQ